jgi:hypothetical protein
LSFKFASSSKLIDTYAIFLVNFIWKFSGKKLIP